MIVEGLKLMVVGMTTVLLFLMFIIFFLRILASLTKDIGEREMAAIQKGKERLKRQREWQKKQATEGDDMDIVVISAAVAAYEAERASTLI